MRNSVFLITPLLQTKNAMLDMTVDDEVNHHASNQICVLLLLGPPGLSSGPDPEECK